MEIPGGGGKVEHINVGKEAAAASKRCSLKIMGSLRRSGELFCMILSDRGKGNTNGEFGGKRWERRENYKAMVDRADWGLRLFQDGGGVSVKRGLGGQRAKNRISPGNLGGLWNVVIVKAMLVWGGGREYA